MSFIVDKRVVLEECLRSRIFARKRDDVGGGIPRMALTNQSSQSRALCQMGDSRIPEGVKRPSRGMQGDRLCSPNAVWSKAGTALSRLWAVLQGQRIVVFRALAR